MLLLDEPMSNLDYRVRLELRHELRALQQRVGITAIYVTHDREEALTLADRIAVIDAGRIAQLGTPDEVFHRPASPFVAGFMGADNALDVVADGASLVAAGRRRAGAALPRALPRRPRAARRARHRRRRRARSRSTARVVQRVYLGTLHRYRVRCGADEVWVDDAERRAEGAPVRVLVPPDALLVFPAAA